MTDKKYLNRWFWSHIVHDFGYVRRQYADTVVLHYLKATSRFGDSLKETFYVPQFEDMLRQKVIYFVNREQQEAFKALYGGDT